MPFYLVVVGVLGVRFRARRFHPRACVTDRAQHADTVARIGANPNNGFADVLAKVRASPRTRAAPRPLPLLILLLPLIILLLPLIILLLLLLLVLGFSRYFLPVLTPT